jgi:RNA polymerase sigma-70 factor (ECF subfamily)
VVRNGALTVARSERRRRRHETVAAAHVPSWFLPSENARLDAETATAALETLPVEERETLVAHLWGGLTFDQIGALIGVSSSTAHRRYLAGLSLLRERLRVPCPKSGNPAPS